jgi:hypothetical protein
VNKKRTEEKIREAAIKLFTSKGYFGTTIRDIAKESKVNIALINYYFRSKEQLFNIIMEDTFDNLFKKIEPIINDNKTTLEQKLNLLVENYLSSLLMNPELPFFILNEINKKPKHFAEKLNLKDKITKSALSRQIMKSNPSLHPLHFIFNLIGMIVFPLIMKPVLTNSGLVNISQFGEIINERKKLIPIWIEHILKLEVFEKESNNNENK